MRKLDQNVRNCLFSKLVKNMHGRVNSKIFFQRTSIKIYLLVQLSKNSLAIVHTKMVRSTKEEKEERKREREKSLIFALKNLFFENMVTQVPF